MPYIIKCIIVLFLIIFLYSACDDGRRDNRNVSKSLKCSSSSIQREPLVFLWSSSSNVEIVNDSVIISSSVESSSSSEFIETPLAIQTRSGVSLEKNEKSVVLEKKDSLLCKKIPMGMICDIRDGMLYRTVRIGSQMWLAQNMNYITERSWCYENSKENCKKYGRLYQWTSALALEKRYLTEHAGGILNKYRQGICPDGWRIPRNSDMKILSDFISKNVALLKNVSENVGTSLKAKKGWEKNEEGFVESDRFGFAALPAGFRTSDGAFFFIKENASFWVAEESENPTHAPYWDLYFANDKFWNGYSNPKATARSVRCLKN